MNEAQNAIDALYTKKVQITDDISKLTPKELSKSTISSDLAKIQKQIDAQQAIIDENMVCVTAQITK